MFPCCYCSSFSGSSFKKLLSHIKFIHSHEPNFIITCGDCSQSFQKFNSFKSHIARKHSAKNVVEIERFNDDADGLEDAAVDDCNEWEDRSEELENDADEEPENFVDEMTRSLALFLLKTKEEYQLSQPAIEAVIDSTEDLVESSMDHLKEQITSCLERNGIDVANIEGLSDVLQQPSMYTQARQPLTNEYQQVQYFKKNFNFVEPEEIILNQRAEYRIVRGRQKLRLVKEVFHYVPIIKTLQALLSHPDVLSEVRNPHTSADDCLRDFCDGEDFRSHGLFGNDSQALVLHCYYDDFEVTNPLGSKTKRHKIGAFYFTLGNLSPQYRSVISMIQLVALCKTSLISTYGMNKVLQPFIRDLNLLESDHGVQFHLEGQAMALRGSIGPFSDDNLGAHVIGGFIESFSSLRICRFCMATSHDIQTKFTENQFQLRTRAAHNRHCQLVLANPTLASTYGVKRASILNQSRYFHVVDGLDLDVMHDQLEGVLPLEIKLLLRKYIRVDEFITLGTLNERVKSFDYGPSDISNKPSPIKENALTNNSASLSQSAAQMWCLARTLPLLIGDVVPENDPHWENFLCLLKIEEIVFAPVSSTQLAAFLAVLVEQYLDEFSGLHNRSCIPKHHNMVHYPRQIVRRGPLVRNWAMRFEAKHNYFKKLADKINNFKNITYSLARRHQALQAYLLQASAGNFLRMSLEAGPGKRSTVVESGLEHELHETDPFITGERTLVRTSWAKVYGTKYARGCVVVVSLCHGVPIFGKVDQVLIVDGQIIILRYKKLRILEYVSHLNAYKVLEQNEMACVKQKQLQDFHPLSLYKGFGRFAQHLFVILRYRVDYL